MLQFRTRLPAIGMATVLALSSVVASSQSTSSISIKPLVPTVDAMPLAANPPVEFAQASSDLQVDPDARFGRMPNGLTYVIYKNRTPSNTAAVWLRVAAGSMMEQEDQRGLAHFVEHMAFNGSKNVPEGEMVKLLQRHGLAFGADTNAQTNGQETLYTLNLPDASDRIIDDALFLMRETADNIGFHPNAIERERGVVLGEERARGGSAINAYEAQMKFMFPGQKFSERLPIGKVNVLKTAQRSAFTRFYNDFYRPEYTTLIVAGDIDVKKVENKIRQRFGDWRAAPQSSAGLTDFGNFIALDKPAVKVFIGSGLPDTISVSWLSPPRDVVQTKSKDRDDLLILFAKNILNERLERIANGADSAFLSAGVQSEDIRHTARIFSLSIRPKMGRDHDALGQAMAVFREFQANGPSQAEVQRVLLQYDSYFLNRVAAAKTIPTNAVAERIANAVRSKGVLQSPAQELAEYEELKPSFTSAAVLTALRQATIKTPPHLWRQGEQKNSFDETAMLAAYRTAMAAPTLGINTRESPVWPYDSFGTPSRIISRRPIPNVGATRVTFENGVTLTVKQTDFVQNDIGVAVNLGNGMAGIGRDQSATLFAARQIGLFPGGLEKLSTDGVREVLAGTNYSVNFGIEGNAVTLGGATTKADFKRQLQVLAAFVLEPAFRPQPLERFKGSLNATFADLKASPLGTYSLEAQAAMFDDDPRFATPSEQALRAVENEDIKAMVKDQLSHGPVEITIVGDISIDAAIAQVGTTFGSLPRRTSAVTLPQASLVSFPTRNLHRIFTHRGREDQNLSVIAWPTTDYYSDPNEIAGLQLLAAILAMRELDEVRENLGASYSATASSEASPDFPGFGFIQTRSQVRPEMDDTYYLAVSDIVESLKRSKVSRDELIRARQPVIDHLRNQRTTNAYWMAVLSGSVREPRQIAATLTLQRHLERITPKDIQKLARKYLVMTRALRIQVKAASSKTQEQSLYHDSLSRQYSGADRIMMN